MQMANRWEAVQIRAKAFLSQPAYKYHTLTSKQLPKEGGIYMIYLLDEASEETPLYINFTSSLRREVLTKQLAHRLINPAAEVLENCYIRFLTEPNAKEQMALTVAISLILKPLYHNN